MSEPQTAAGLGLLAAGRRGATSTRTDRWDWPKTRRLKREVYLCNLSVSYVSFYTIFEKWVENTGLSVKNNVQTRKISTCHTQRYYTMWRKWRDKLSLHLRVNVCFPHLYLWVFLGHRSKVSFDALLLLDLQRVDPNQRLVVHHVVKTLQLLFGCTFHLQTRDKC